jgi:hypothetical protein
MAVDDPKLEAWRRRSMVILNSQCSQQQHVAIQQPTDAPGQYNDRIDGYSMYQAAYMQP